MARGDLPHGGDILASLFQQLVVPFMLYLLLHIASINVIPTVSSLCFSSHLA